jgi:hypothetical protein
LPQGGARQNRNWADRHHPFAQLEAVARVQSGVLQYAQHFRWAVDFLNMTTPGPTIVYTDSQSAMKLLKREDSDRTSDQEQMIDIKIR